MGTEYDNDTKHRYRDNAVFYMVIGFGTQSAKFDGYEGSYTEGIDYDFQDSEYVTTKHTEGGNGGNRKAGVYSTQHTKYDGSTGIYGGGSGYGYQGTEYDNDTRYLYRDKGGHLYVRWM